MLTLIVDIILSFRASFLGGGEGGEGGGKLVCFNGPANTALGKQWRNNWGFLLGANGKYMILWPLLVGRETRCWVDR
jgi:hypothetical protein